MLLSKCCKVDACLVNGWKGNSWFECGFCFQPCEVYTVLSLEMEGGKDNELATES